MAHSIIILSIAEYYYHRALESASTSYYGNRDNVKFFHNAFDSMLNILSRNNITYEQFLAWYDSRFIWEE